MHGSVCIRNGIVYVGNHARTATVRTFDLDGHRLESGFSFGAAAHGALGASATGLTVDDDHRVWVADPVGGCVRAFSLFGVEHAGLSVAGAIDVAAAGVEDDQVLLVGSQRDGRRAVRLWRPGGEAVATLRSLGDPKRSFLDVVGVALLDRFVFVCEARPRRVQVFRDGEFHFAIEPPAVQTAGSARAPEPRAVAALPDGRIVLALAGEPSALLLLDGAGRLVRVLAVHGNDDGAVFHPTDLALEDAGVDDRHKRLVVIDREGERVQVFTVAGTCYGAFDV